VTLRFRDSVLIAIGALALIAVGVCWALGLNPFVVQPQSQPAPAPLPTAENVVAYDLDGFTTTVDEISPAFDKEAAVDLAAQYCALLTNGNEKTAKAQIAAAAEGADVDADAVVAVAEAGRDYLCPDAG